MYRKLVVLVLLAATVAASFGESSVQAAGLLSRGLGNGGILARLNRPLVPTLPGLPTASPLGLIAPRLSNAVLMFQKGGLATQAGRLGAIGLLSPRVSPIVALLRTPPKTPQARFMYGLTILAPRATVLVGMIRAASGMAAGLR